MCCVRFNLEIVLPTLVKVTGGRESTLFLRRTVKGQAIEWLQRHQTGAIDAPCSDIWRVALCETQFLSRRVFSLPNNGR
jgi:hypothetical protein